MTRRIPLLFASSALALIATFPVQANEAALLEEARKIATSMPPKLLTVLEDEIRKGGPEGAIGVCRDKAPVMAKTMAEQTGWGIRRVSLKNRNPKAVPDGWERAALEDFDKRTAAGEKPTSIEKGEIVEEEGKKVYRYLKALPTQDVCLQCHGGAERIPEPVKAKLKELYPEDKAVGYGPAEIRGAITLKKPL